MTSMTFDSPRCFPWFALLSVGIHAAVVASLLYFSVHQVVELPPPAQPVSVTLVAPAEPEPVGEPVQEPVVEPEPEPEPIPEPPKEAPVVIHKPKPKPKPRPKPKQEWKVEQAKRNVQPQPRPASPFDNNAPVRPQTADRPASTSGVAQARAPRAVSRIQPGYPARATALRIEGNVRVRFDVSSDGRVENVRILSAKPANIFERDVKTAMRRWRYEAGRPGKDLVVNIVFRINGGASME